MIWDFFQGKKIKWDFDLINFYYRFRPYDMLKIHKEPILTISSSSQLIVTGSAGREIQLINSSSSNKKNQNMTIGTNNLFQHTTTVLNNPGLLLYLLLYWSTDM